LRSVGAQNRKKEKEGEEEREMDYEEGMDWVFSAPQWHDFSLPDDWLDPNVAQDDYFGQ
jgi:hypothetical protein